MSVGNQITNAILKAVLYADIFDYVPSATQLLPKLQSTQSLKDQITTQDILQLVSQNAKSTLTVVQDRVLLKEKMSNLEKSIKKYHLAEKKKMNNKKLAALLRYIPTIEFLGITGSVAAQNAQEDDDIDYMVITSPGKLWTTRFQIIALTHMLGNRRSPGDTMVSNKWCFNLFIDKSQLTVPKHKQNLYIAHEITQIMPVLDKNNTFQEFLSQNQWSKKYLPNANAGNSLQTLIHNPKNSFTETLFREFQFAYMKNRRTTELVDNYRAFFYPRDYQKTVLTQFDNRLKQYNLYS